WLRTKRGPVTVPPGAALARAGAAGAGRAPGGGAGGAAGGAPGAGGGPGAGGAAGGSPRVPRGAAAAGVARRGAGGGGGGGGGAACGARLGLRLLDGGGVDGIVRLKLPPQVAGVAGRAEEQYPHSDEERSAGMVIHLLGLEHLLRRAAVGGLQPCRVGVEIV